MSCQPLLLLLLPMAELGAAAPRALISNIQWSSAGVAAKLHWLV